MVLGILTAIAACPAIIGTTEAVRQGQKANAKDRHRGVRSNLIVSCLKNSIAARKINGRPIVLRNKKLYIAATENSDQETQLQHLFTGYFLPYPDQDWGRMGEGLVSTISDEPPQLNWIYMDEQTYEIKHGIRKDSEGHTVGPWNCTQKDKRLTLEGWEGFMVVEEDDGSWALYFDRDDNGLKGNGFKGSILEVEIIRVEKRKGREDEN